MSVDAVTAIQTVLLADAAVAALVSTRVYYGEVPAAAVATMPQACIVVNGAGGSGEGGFGEYGNERVDVICYGAALSQSRAVYRAAYLALKQMRSKVASSVLLYSATPISKGVTARDPVNQWSTTLSSFLVLASEIAA